MSFSISVSGINAEQKDQKGGYDEHSDDQIFSDCTLVESLFWRRVGGTSMNSVFRHICFPPSQDLTILPFSCRCQFPHGRKGRPSGSCCTQAEDWVRLKHPEIRFLVGELS